MPLAEDSPDIKAQDFIRRIATLGGDQENTGPARKAPFSKLARQCWIFML
jgi:hypothetical protein